MLLLGENPAEAVRAQINAEGEMLQDYTRLNNIP